MIPDTAASSVSQNRKGPAASRRDQGRRVHSGGWMAISKSVEASRQRGREVSKVHVPYMYLPTSYLLVRLSDSLSRGKLGPLLDAKATSFRQRRSNHDRTLLLTTCIDDFSKHSPQTLQVATHTLSASSRTTALSRHLLRASADAFDLTHRRPRTTPPPLDTTRLQ